METGFDEVKDKIQDIEQTVQKVRKDPSFLGHLLKHFWLTFKKPLFIVVLLALGILILIPPLTYLYFIRDLSSKTNIINHKNAGVILTDRNGKTFFTLYSATSKHTVTLSNISKTVQQAVVASEDKNFYTNPGFSIKGIGRAFIEDIQNQDLSQGGSTITQQLVKNTLLTQQKDFLRKYQELFLAIEIDRRFSKDDILEMYLNTVYFGEGAFGVEDAAKVYFGKDARDLTLSEGALLAGILPAPSAYSPLSGDRTKAFQRQKIVLSLMEQQGYITKAQEMQAENQTLIFKSQRQSLNQTAPHFALMVQKELIDKYGEQTVANSGFKVQTTIDLGDQQYAEQAVSNQVDRLKYDKVTNGAAIALDPKTGEILSLVGSHDWFDPTNGKINMVTTPRQPGSSFKPIVYSYAIANQLITAATVLDDKPITYPDGYQPLDYDRKFRGEVLARRALANSLNIPAVHVMERVGVANTIEWAQQLGITTLTDPSKYGLSLVLGAAEVPLLQMTEAYSVFADNGQRITPTTILQIQDKNGNVIYTYQPAPTQVLSPSVAFIISSILSDNAARAEEFGNALTISRPAAVKTGTTNDFKDALTIGYTPSLVVGVWVGNNDNTPMDSIAGSLGAAPIWRQMMEHMLQGTPVEKFNPPPEVLQVTICKENGLRAEAATSSAMTEFFLPGTIPTQSCTGPQPTISEDQTPTPTSEVPTQSENNQSQPTPTATPTVTPTPIPSQPTDTPTPILPSISLQP
ncbi:MAG TPA: PBP1A family penicillin-binding protein [Patescibacteria group bacterium]|nr:PBP1A family penicillin-binding protein [Patescibacteria group bacterium]